MLNETRRNSPAGVSSLQRIAKSHLALGELCFRQTAITETLRASIGIVFAIFLASIAIALGIVEFVPGVQSMLHLGVAPSAGPSLWIMIPILTLLVTA
jgi:hypothetical protein